MKKYRRYKDVTMEYHGDLYVNTSDKSHIKTKTSKSKSKQIIQMTVPEKLEYMKLHLDKNPGAKTSTQYMIFITAYNRSLEDVSISLTNFEKSCIEHLFHTYDIPLPTQNLKFKKPQSNQINNSNSELTFFLLEEDDLNYASIVFTGFRSSELNAVLRDKFSATVEEKVSAATDIVVAKNSSTKITSKIRDAINKNIPIITLSHLNELIVPSNPNSVIWRR